MTIEKIGLYIGVVSAILSLPLWVHLFKWFKLPDKIEEHNSKFNLLYSELEKFKKETRDKHIQHEKKYEEIKEEMTNTALKSIEVMGNINITLAELKTSIISLNKSISQSENYVSKVIEKLHDDLNEHRKSSTELITKLIDINGKD